MKRKVCILLAFLMILQCLFLFSCNKEKDEPGNIGGRTLTDPDAIFYYAHPSATIYENFVFFPKNNAGVGYNFLDEIVPQSIGIYDKSVGTNNDNPFYYADDASFVLVDEEASIKNDGLPILYIVAKVVLHPNERETGADGSCVSYFKYKIIKYNTANNSASIIAEDMPNSILSFAKYGDTLIYGTSDADEGYNIHCVDTDGKNHRVFENPDKMACRIQTVYRDKMYFIDQKTMEMYRINLSDFSSLEKIGKAYIITHAFAHSGYIYYANNQRREKLGEDPKLIFDLCRRSVDDISKEEVIIEKVTSGNFLDEKYYYFLLENAKSFINPLGKTLYDDGWGKCYEFDPKSAESTLFYDLGTNYDFIVRFPIAKNDEYMLFNCTTNENPKFLKFVSLADGKEHLIPD